MRRPLVLVLLCGVLLGLAAPAGHGKSASRKDIPKVFKRIAKAWKKGDVKTITGMLPAEGKIRLALLGVKSGKYRREQATALLTKYFASIETVEFKLDAAPRNSPSAQFKHTFKVKPKRSKETRFEFITLGREKNRWVITEIIED